MEVIALAGVDVDFDTKPVLVDLNWMVGPDERWVVLGPNGSGKTTLMRLASLYLHPTRGIIEVLGHRLGTVDVRRLRERIGLVSDGFAKLLRPGVTALEVVMSGRRAALETWWHDYTVADEHVAVALLERFDVGAVSRSAFGTLSSGEQQRVLLARSMANAPELLLLDEPMAGLDLAGREQLIASLATLAADPAAPTMVLVTHHLEEIPPGFTHALLLRDGHAVASGAIDEVITDDAMSDCFALDLHVERDRTGRYRLGGV